MRKQRAKWGGEDKPAFLDALKKTLGRVYEAAELCGIHPRTHYTWMDTDVDYKEQVRLIKERSIDFVESKLFENISGNNQRAIEYYLNHKAKERGYNTEADNEKTIPPITINWTPPPPQEQ